MTKPSIFPVKRNPKWRRNQRKRKFIGITQAERLKLQEINPEKEHFTPHKRVKRYKAKTQHCGYCLFWRHIAHSYEGNCGLDYSICYRDTEACESFEVIASRRRTQKRKVRVNWGF